MILPFTTVYRGKQNFFVEKILRGLEGNISEGLFTKYESMALTGYGGKYDFNRSAYTMCKAKIHTLRTDEKKRWFGGRDVHQVINNRTKRQLQFTPTLECKSTQTIVITSNERVRSVIIDGLIYAAYDPRQYYHPSDISILKLTALAVNDGFDSVDEFFEYFAPNFSGKIIHWTDFKY